MNTNINTDNYEAYLLDYLEGNLSPDEAEQLKAFVAAQGMDWDELTEELPHLEAPAIAHPDKESLKNRPLSLSKGRTERTIPLYVKIASAAAAAGLLLTVTLWPEKQTPTIEPITDQSPLNTTEITIDSVVVPVMPEVIETTSKRTTIKKKAVAPDRVLVAEFPELKMIAMTKIPVDTPAAEFKRPTSLWNTEYLNNEWDSTQLASNTNDVDFEAYQHNPSLISRGLLWLTDGRHDSFGSLIHTSLSTAKKEVSLAATDLALTAYNRADERFEEMKENWQEKRGE